METIEVTTDNRTYVVMNSERAAQIRSIERMRKGRVLFDRSDNNTVTVEAPSVPRLVREAGKRALSGQVLNVDGELHFQPDGYRYLVPIDVDGPGDPRLSAGLHVRVHGRVSLRNGQPDRFIIEAATPI